MTLKSKNRWVILFALLSLTGCLLFLMHTVVICLEVATSNFGGVRPDPLMHKLWDIRVWAIALAMSVLLISTHVYWLCNKFNPLSLATRHTFYNILKILILSMLVFIISTSVMAYSRLEVNSFYYVLDLFLWSMPMTAALSLGNAYAKWAIFFGASLGTFLLILFLDILMNTRYPFKEHISGYLMFISIILAFLSAGSPESAHNREDYMAAISLSLLMIYMAIFFYPLLFPLFYWPRKRLNIIV